MVQMPLPVELQKYKTEIIYKIKVDKDVDGMRQDSEFLHPTSKAVMEIINIAQKYLGKKKRVCVVGSKGMVGAPLTKELKKEGYTVTEIGSKTLDVTKFIKSAEIVISATGKPGIIKPNMVTNGVIIIDVGSPHGDVEPEVVKKASFFTPVPGGVGPVTISCLLDNLLQACQKKVVAI